MLGGVAKIKSWKNPSISALPHHFEGHKRSSVYAKPTGIFYMKEHPWKLFHRINPLTWPKIVWYMKSVGQRWSPIYKPPACIIHCTISSALLAIYWSSVLQNDNAHICIVWASILVGDLLDSPRWKLTCQPHLAWLNRSQPIQHNHAYNHLPSNG